MEVLLYLNIGNIVLKWRYYCTIIIYVLAGACTALLTCSRCNTRIMMLPWEANVAIPGLPASKPPPVTRFSTAEVDGPACNDDEPPADITSLKSVAEDPDSLIRQSDSSPINMVRYL